MNRKLLPGWFRLVLPALALLTGSAAIEAAPLVLGTGEPDVALFGAVVTYTAPICAKSAGGSGSAATAICGTVINVGGTNNDGTYNGALVTPGTLTIRDDNTIDADPAIAGGDSDSMAYFGDGNNGAGFFGNYNLTAYFNADGVFQPIIGSNTSSLSLIMTDQGVVNLGNGTNNFTIVTAALGSFGFSGTGANGTLQLAGGDLWGGAGITGGDWDTLYDAVKVSVSTLNITGGTIPTATAAQGGWDADVNSDGDTDLFKTNWNGTSAVDTFVPVPAAVWLFGTGLAALAGFARRRRVVGA